MEPLTKFSSVFLWSVFLILEGNIVSGEIEMNEICIISDSNILNANQLLCTTLTKTEYIM